MNEQQIKLCQTAPPKDALKTRKQAGRDLTYIEGWWAIEQANKIFGEGEWGRSISGLLEVYRAAVDVPVPNDPTGRTRPRYEVAFLCQYDVFIMGGSHVEDVGYGIGQSYDNFGAACESAAKEAVTDALKRCLRSFGDAFGNCLYDKEWLKDEAGGKHEPPAGKEAATQPTVAPPPATTYRDDFRQYFAGKIKAIAKATGHDLKAPTSEVGWQYLGNALATRMTWFDPAAPPDSADWTNLINAVAKLPIEQIEGALDDARLAYASANKKKGTTT